MSKSDEQIVRDALKYVMERYAEDCPDDFGAAFERLMSHCVPELPQRWLPIDTAPKDGTWILVCRRGELYCENGFTPLVAMFGIYHPNAKGDGCWRDTNRHKTYEPTHWMPLPSPPKDTL